MAPRAGTGRGRGKGGAKVVPLRQNDGKGPPPAGHNREAVEAAEQAQLISFVSKLIAKDKEIDASMAVVKGHRDERKEIVNLAKAAGFKANELEPLITDMKVKGNRKDLTESELRRMRFRRYLGLPNGEDGQQREMMPQAARDEVDWETAGYTAGIRGDEPKPPGDCPTMFHQAWMRGYHNGRKSQTEAAAAPMIAKQESARADAAAKEPEPEKEPDPKAEEQAMRDSLESLGSDAPEPPDDFEASEEELAQQTGRRKDEDAEEPEAV